MANLTPDVTAAVDNMNLIERYRLKERFEKARSYYERAKGEIGGQPSQKTFLRAVDMNPDVPWWDPTKTPLFNDESSQYVYMLYGIYRSDLAATEYTQRVALIATIIMMIVFVWYTYYYEAGATAPPQDIEKK